MTLDLFAQDPAGPDTSESGGDVSTLKAKTAVLIRYAKAYYSDDDPLVSDATYDALYREVAELESQLPGHINPNSPTQRVGGERLPHLGEIEHTVPMLSLDNKFDDEGLAEFFGKIIGPQEAIYGEPKFDGLAISLLYRDGKLAYAATRGDGKVGEDVTHNIRLIHSIPVQLDTATPPALLEVRGEVYMARHILDKLNKEAEATGGKVLVNCRNAAAGTVRKLDPKEAAKRPLDFFAYSIAQLSDEGQGNFSTHSEQMAYLRSIGFPVCSESAVLTISELPEFVARIQDKRDSLTFDADGLVFKVDSLDRQKELGEQSRVPRWGIARKLPAEQKEAVVEAVEWQVGATGAVTPVAKLTPVHVGGVTVSSVTLHNMDIIRSLDIAVGDTAICERRGDVVPGITGITQRPADRKPITLPDGCPVCGSALDKEEEHSVYRCTGGMICSAQQVRLIQMGIGREYLNIDGAGDKLIEQLVKNGMISTIADLYTLDCAAVADLPGMGIKSAEKLRAGLEASKHTTLGRILSCLSIREVGKSASVELANHFGHDLDRIIGASKEELRSVPTFGPIMTELAYEGFRNPVNIQVLEGLLAAGLSWDIPQEIPEGEQPLKGEKWVVTGSFEGFTRDDIKAKLQALGATVSGSISAKTTALAAGAKAGGKLAKANDLGIRVVEEAELLSMF